MKTALDQLIEKMSLEDVCKYSNELAEAKEMEKEQIVNSYRDGRSVLLCGFFEADNKTSSATKCKCGREKWEHPKAT